MGSQRAPVRDPVVAALNALRLPELRFEPATDEVVAGLDLRATGNRSYGKSVYIATGAVPEVDRRRILVGRTLAVGAVEHHAHGELRCFEDGGTVAVAAFAPSGVQRGPVLRHRPPEGAAIGPRARFDEALFAWLAPAEDYSTPWSDSSPAVCQVITIDRLRTLVTRG